jgi:hypothetical protein
MSQSVHGQISRRSGWRQAKLTTSSQWTKWGGVGKHNLEQLPAKTQMARIARATVAEATTPTVAGLIGVNNKPGKGE